VSGESQKVSSKFQELISVWFVLSHVSVHFTLTWGLLFLQYLFSFALSFFSIRCLTKLAPSYIQDEIEIKKSKSKPGPQFDLLATATLR